MPSVIPNNEPNQRQGFPLWLRASWPIAAGIALIALLLFAFDMNPFVGLDRAWGDAMLRARFRAGLEPPPDAKIFLVGIDTRDITGTNNSEAEYDSYADILDTLTDLRVSAVGMDLIMLRGREPDARRIRDAIAASRHVVLAEASTPMVARSFPFAAPQGLSGLIDIAADPDGVHRRYSYGIVADPACKPSLALSVYLASFSPPRMATCTKDGGLEWNELAADMVTLAPFRLPARSVLLNFRSPHTEPWERGFKYISAHDLLTKYKQWRDAGAEPQQTSRRPSNARQSRAHRSVTAAAGDAGATPFGRLEPFLQLHATALNDLMQGLPLSEIPPAGNLAFTIAGIFLLTLAGSRVRGIWMLALSGATVILAVLVLSVSLLIRMDTVIAAITPVAFMAVALFGESARRASLESIEKAYLRQTLGRYFSPNVLEDVLKNPDAMQPREAELTVLLTDVRNFTTITERYGTKRMFDLLNDIFEVETQAVIALDGSMEHFVGDQFLAYWGAPQEQLDAADRALETASRIIRGLDALHGNLEPGVKELFGYGVALHCGKALFGNKGARARLDYGILGDIVNGAARIESLTKYYGVRQIVTREVMEKALKKPPARFLSIGSV